MSICKVPLLSEAPSALQSSSVATKIHLYKSHTHTHTHQLFSCKAQTGTFLGQSLKKVQVLSFK